MKTLFVLDTSPRADAQSRHLSEHFVEAWSRRHPDGRVVHRDIGTAPPAHMDDELIEALRKQPDILSERQKAARQASDAMIAEMQEADAIVVAAPMHNFTVSGALRAWIDHVTRPGVTFGYDAETGPYGMLDDKPVYVISTRGGQYGAGDPENPHPADFQTGYIRFIFGFIGLKDVRIIPANGMDMGPEARAKGFAEATNAIDAVFGDDAEAA